LFQMKLPFLVGGGIVFEQGLEALVEVGLD
jgi:hypothetical protein